MTDITIYTTELCGYCARAKRLLESKGLTYTEIDVSYDPDERRRMSERAGGRRTVPQVFVGGTHVGGNEDLQRLEAAGKLDDLLVTT